MAAYSGTTSRRSRPTSLANLHRSTRLESEHLIPPPNDFTALGVVPTQSSSAGGISCCRPVRTHVLKLHRPRRRVREVPDQFPENPGLLRIADATMQLRPHRVGKQFGPGEVREQDLGVGPHPDAGARVLPPGTDLVRDREYDSKPC